MIIEKEAILDKKQVCFLVYLNRSGSTLLASLLNKYEDIGVSLEANFPDGIWHGDDHVRNPRELDRYLDRVYQDPKFEAWDIQRTVLHAALMRHNFPFRFSQILPVILKQYFAKNKKDIHVFKSPYLFNIDFLRREFKGCKIIFVRRDPRAIFNSQIKTVDTEKGKPMARNPLKVALAYNQAMRIAAQFKDKPWFHTVSYEQLIGDTEIELKKVLTFLVSSGIAQEGQADYFRSISSKQKNIHTNIARKPMQARVVAWKKELSVTDIAVMERASGQELLHGGYELTQQGQLRGMSFVYGMAWIRFLLIFKGKFTLLKRIFFTQRALAKDPA